MAEAQSKVFNRTLNGPPSLTLEARNQDAEEYTIQVSPKAPKKRTLSKENTTKDDDRDSKRRKGTAPVKAEYLILDEVADGTLRNTLREAANDDAAEACHHKDRQPSGNNAR